MTSKVYKTRDEAVSAEVVLALASGLPDEDVRALFDVEAIGRRVLVWEDAYMPELDAYWLPGQGFRLAVSEEEFWEIVREHELPQESEEGQRER